MTRVLLYNITGEKLAKIQSAAGLLGLTLIEVPEDAFGNPIGYMLGHEGFRPSDSQELFSDEMLVMEELCSPLLDTLRAEGAPIALKAVVTDHNRTWSSAKLHAELLQEHEAMQRLRPKKAGSRHPHKKKK